MINLYVPIKNENKLKTKIFRKQFYRQMKFSLIHLSLQIYVFFDKYIMRTTTNIFVKLVCLALAGTMLNNTTVSSHSSDIGVCRIYTKCWCRIQHRKNAKERIKSENIWDIDGFMPFFFFNLIIHSNDFRYNFFFVNF